jgi:hypothetical protein
VIETPADGLRQPAVGRSAAGKRRAAGTGILGGNAARLASFRRLHGMGVRKLGMSVQLQQEEQREERIHDMLSIPARRLFSPT